MRPKKIQAATALNFSPAPLHVCLLALNEYTKNIDKKNNCSLFLQAAYVYTPEVYPTVLRSVGVGSCSGMARLGAALTPYIAQVLMKNSLKLAVAVYVAVALIAAFSCIMLPFETRGHEMSDHRNRSSSNK